MWDKRYDTQEHVYGTEPNDFLAEHFTTIPKGKVLCLAEGEGRNAVFLARQGYAVTAVDASKVGLDKAQKLAVESNVDLEVVHADLADFSLGENEWDGIVAIFCHLPVDVRQQVHRQIPIALRPGGVFLLEAYTPDQLAFATGGPTDRDLLLSANILQSELRGLKFHHLAEVQREVVEGSFHTGRAAVVQAIASKDRSRYKVSSNRGSATHKVRYVESGGGEENKNCRACQPTPKPRD